MTTPQVSPLLTSLFRRYSRGFVGRHFHAVRLLQSHGLTSASAELPVVVFLNHASWWDPLVCLLLAREFFPGRTSCAPIDAQALQRYRFLRRLGFFGIANGSPRGAAEFLRTSTELLENPRHMLWLTPQGKFTDARARPVTLQSGLAHLAARSGPAMFLPLAIEYTFWEERKPEVLVAFGTPLFNQQHRDSCGANDWSSAFAATLQDAQDALAGAAQRRQPNEWQVLLRADSGTAPVYDLWRRLRAAVQSEPFQQEHSTL